jgi:hypothetical protein
VPPHESHTRNDLTKNATNTIEIKSNRSKMNEANRYSAAHNGLVAGSSPAGPTIAGMYITIPTIPGGAGLRSATGPQIGSRWRVPIRGHDI